MRIASIRSYGVEQNKMINRTLGYYQTTPLKQDSVSFSGSVETAKAGK